MSELYTIIISVNGHIICIITNVVLIVDEEKCNFRECY